MLHPTSDFAWKSLWGKILFPPPFGCDALPEKACCAAYAADLSPISRLSDADLSEIFKRLPPSDRLVVSEVCRRWHRLSRMAWLDVHRLDLGPVPSHLHAIVRLCPYLQTVFAKDSSFSLGALHCLPKATRLTSVKLYHCRFAVEQTESDEGSGGLLRRMFGDFTDLSCNELVMHHACVAGISPFEWHFDGQLLPPTLTRLQITGLRGGSNAVKFSAFLPLNLECLFLHASPADAEYKLMEYGNCLDEIMTLKNLRELWLSPVANKFWGTQLGPFVSSMPKLEVLFLNHVSPRAVPHLSDVITLQSSLRILVLSGGLATADDDLIEIPARKHLPKLSVFLGKIGSQNLHFDYSDLAPVEYIDAPMPEFLLRPEIAPIFDGVWIAEKICEAAQNGSELWRDEVPVNAAAAAADQ